MSGTPFLTKSRIRIFVFVLLFAVAAFLLLAFVPLVRDIIIQYKGHVELATVKKVPLACWSRQANLIKVSVDNREYPFPITAGECRAEKYKVGMQFPVRRYAAYDTLIGANDRPDYMLAFYLAWLAAFLFIVRYFWRRYKKVRGQI